MPLKIIAQPNQSMQDLVLMACGTLDAAMAFCRANGVSISDVPPPGNIYTIPDGLVRNNNVLRDLQRNNIVIGTLYDPPPPPPPPSLITGHRILLDPRMSVAVANDPGMGMWYMRYADTGSFVNYYPLQSSFETANILRFAKKIDIESGGPSYPTAASPAIPPDKNIRWNNSTYMSGGYYLYSSDISGITTSTWKDVMGNSAIYAPVILMKSDYQNNQLISTIDVHVEEVLEAAIRFRLIWLHPVITLAPYSILGMNWLEAASGGTPIPGLPNCVTVTLPIGIHTIGAAVAYTNGTTFWPSSYKTLVLEVY